MSEKVYDLTDAGDTEKTYFVRRDGQDHIIKTGCDDDVLAHGSLNGILK